MTTTQFEAGKTYSTRSICNHDCVVSVTILKRTAKTVTCEVWREVKTFRVSEYNGAEQFRPWGSYSMCPVISATDSEIENASRKAA